MVKTAALLSLLLLLSVPLHSLVLFSKDSPWDLLLTPGLVFPTPREGHTATIIDSNLYVFGGYYPSRAFWGRDRVPDVVYDQLFVLDLNTFEWQQLGGVPVPDQPYEGLDFHESRNEAVEEDNGLQISVARAPIVTKDEVITQSSLRFLHEEQIEGLMRTARNGPSAKRYLPSSRQSSSNPPALGSHSAVGINGQLYIFGGLTESGDAVTNALYRYNPVKNTWSLLSSGKGPAARAGATAWSHQDRVYIFGGYDPAQPAAFADTWYFDTKTLKWNIVPTSASVPGPRVFTSAVEMGVYEAVMYSGQTNAPYQPGNLADSVSAFDGNWSTVTPTKRTNPVFPLPASNAASAYFVEKETYVSIGGLAGPWSRQINRCGWYNPSENNFVGYDAVGDVRIFLASTQVWERGSDAPFWAFRNLTGRVFGSAPVRYGNNLLFFGGVGCEDQIGLGIKPYPAMYGRFNQIPIYNIFADPRTTVSAGETLSASVSLSLFAVCVALLAWVGA